MICLKAFRWSLRVANVDRLANNLQKVCTRVGPTPQAWSAILFAKMLSFSSSYFICLALSLSLSSFAFSLCRVVRVDCSFQVCIFFFNLVHSILFITGTITRWHTVDFFLDITPQVFRLHANSLRHHSSTNSCVPLCYFFLEDSTYLKSWNDCH
jgi:hypothetical protein